MKKFLILFLVLVLGIFSPLCTAAEDAPFFIEAEKVTANVGDTVSVKFFFRNNPGISLFTLGIDYNKSALVLKEVNGNSLMGGMFTPNVNEDFVLWMSSSRDSTFNGTVFTAVFQVLETAKPGKTEVSVSLPYGTGDILNNNGDEIKAEILSGYVDIAGLTKSGDVNNDTVINLQDVTLLSQFLAGWDVTVNDSALDTDGDTLVNLNDLVLLSQFVAGWNVELA